MTGWQTFDLPRPVSTNALYVTMRSGRRVKTKAYVTWLRAAGWMIKAKKPKAVQVRVPCEVKIQVTDEWRGDSDNSLKCLLDAMQEFGVILNDKLVRKLTIERGAKVEGSRVSIRPLKEKAG